MLRMPAGLELKPHQAAAVQPQLLPTDHDSASQYIQSTGVLQMPALRELKTPAYLRRLQQQGTDQSLWEVGASCNFLIAAARLGMRAAAVANLGEDVYGKYLLDILQVSARIMFSSNSHVSVATCCVNLLSACHDLPALQAQAL